MQKKHASKIALALGISACVVSPAAAVNASTIQVGDGASKLGSLAVGDFDQDGNLDVAVTAKIAPAPPMGPPTLPERGVVYVLKGDGHGLLTDSPIDSHTEDRPFGGVKTADLENNGTTDLVLGEEHGVLLRINNGDGSWTTKRVGDAGIGEVSEIEVADFDGDTDPDVAVIDDARSLFILKNAGGRLEWVDVDGTAGADHLTLPGRFSSLLAVDLNGDGFKDLAGTLPGSDQVVTLRNAGDGSDTFSIGGSTDTGTEPTDVEAVQASNGIENLAVAERGDGNIALLTNDGSGAMTRSQFTSSGPGSSPAALTKILLHRDAECDGSAQASDEQLLVAANLGLSSLSLFGSDMQYRDALPVGAAPVDVVAANLDEGSNGVVNDLITANDDSTLTVTGVPTIPSVSSCAITDSATTTTESATATTSASSTNTTTTAVKLGISVAKKLKLSKARKLSIKVKLSQAGTARAYARIKVGKKTYKVKTVSAKLGKNVYSRVNLKLSKSTRAVVKRALAAKHKVKVTFYVSGTSNEGVVAQTSSGSSKASKSAYITYVK